VAVILRAEEAGFGLGDIRVLSGVLYGDVWDGERRSR
jgi:hypothetical protein